VSLQRDLNLIAPRLRRYARALVCAHAGPNEAVDTMVGAALRQVFAEGASHSAADLEVAAYASFTELNRENSRAIEFGGPSHGASALIKVNVARATGGRPPERWPNIRLSDDTLSSALLALKLEEREVLLLVNLEGLSYVRAARILKISRSILVARLARARERLPSNLQAQSVVTRRATSRPPHLRLVK